MVKIRKQTTRSDTRKRKVKHAYQEIKNTYLEVRNTYQDTQKITMPKTYARAASSLYSNPAAPETERRVINKHEVVLVKPEKEKEDRRTNEEIKTDLLSELGKIKNNLKVRSIRQMRNKGLIVEVDGEEDKELIKGANLARQGLVANEPKRIDPIIIIYDVENEYGKKELKEDFTSCNEEDMNTLEEAVTFQYSYDTKKNRKNWIVRVPGKFYNKLTNRDRIYMQWRTYRFKENLNIVRCFKCHGYGHFAKYCNIKEQLCENCGVQDHIRTECPRKEKPQCINCIRNKRRETQHKVKSSDCPEYKKQIERYKNKIK